MCYDYNNNNICKKFNFVFNIYVYCRVYNCMNKYLVKLKYNCFLNCSDDSIFIVIILIKIRLN